MQVLDKDILTEKLEKSIGEDIKCGRVGGAAVYVMQDGNDVYKNSFGYKSINSGEKLCTNTVFRLASMTKPITAVCVMILKEREKIDLSLPVSAYIPSFNACCIGKIDEQGRIIKIGEAKREITVGMLLSHTSGLGNCRPVGTAQMNNMPLRYKKNLKTAVEYYCDMLLDFEPGEDENYSPIAGFDILARIVEIASKMSFADFASENVFKPLGMNSTTFAPTSEIWKRMIAMYDYKDNKAVETSMEGHIFSDLPLTYTCGGAGAVSCIDDYSKFAQMLLNGGEYNGVRILSEESVNDIHTQHISEKIENPSEIWGYGVRVNKNGFYKEIPNGAYGWSGAYGTHFWVDPINKITAVYMKNSLYDGGSGAKTARKFENDVYASLK